MKKQTKGMPGQISFDLKGRVVMITGAGRGFVDSALAEFGHIDVLVDRGFTAV